MENINLSEIISAAVDGVIKTDLQKVVEKEVKECLASVIDNVFGYHSAARKNLEEKFTTQIGICLENLKIENYNIMVLDAIQNTISGELSNRIEDKLKSGILARLSILNKSNYKLSEIIEEFKEELLRDMDDNDEKEFTVIVENSSCNFTYIYIDEEDNQDKYHCKYRICLYDGKVSNCSPVSPPEKKAYGFENFLFALYANNVNIEVDSNYDTYVSNSYDD